jgi:hypothetical protein
MAARAQDPLDDVYGHAVHAYYRGDVARAQELLDQAIAAGSKDPRAYYYRGLCLSALGGDTSAGMADFQTAADLEINGQKVVNVGKALERVQGAPRDSDAPPTPVPAANDPFAPGLDLNKGAPTPMPESNKPVAPATNDPFGDAPADTNKGEPPASDDPFGGSSAPPASDDPFGGN